MFRLINLHVQRGIPRIGVTPDRYVSERAAVARYRETPAAYFGVGRFDVQGRLTEVIIDTLCGPIGDCPRPASLVHAVTFQRLCDSCAYGLDVLTVADLSVQLGVAVRLARVPARTGPSPAPGPRYGAGYRIAREFASHVADPAWRTELCEELARNPGSVNGVLIGIGALSHRDVLDLYPALCALGDGLPPTVHADLIRAADRPLSPAGMAALRLGLNPPRSWSCDT